MLFLARLILLRLNHTKKYHKFSLKKFSQIIHKPLSKKSFSIIDSFYFLIKQNALFDTRVANTTRLKLVELKAKTTHLISVGMSLSVIIYLHNNCFFYSQKFYGNAVKMG